MTKAIIVMVLIVRVADLESLKMKTLWMVQEITFSTAQIQMTMGICYIMEHRSNRNSSTTVLKSESEAVMFRSKAVVHKSEDMVFKIEVAVHRSKDVVLQHKDMVLKSEVVVCKCKDVVFKSKAVVHKSEDVVPQHKDMVLKSKDVALQRKDMVPKGKNVVLKGENVAHRDIHQVTTAVARGLCGGKNRLVHDITYRIILLILSSIYRR